MTEAQTEVFNKVNELLMEHFEGYIIAVVDENESGKICSLQYHGGLLQGIGLAHAARAKLTESQCASIAFASEIKDQED